MSRRRPLRPKGPPEPLHVVFIRRQQLTQEGDVACLELTRALREERLVASLPGRGDLPSSYWHDKSLAPDPEDHFAVVAVDSDGRLMRERFYVWEPAENYQESKNIFSAPINPPEGPERHGPGRPPIYDWPEIRTEIAQRIFPNGKLTWPKNNTELAAAIREWCKKTRKKVPPDNKLRDAIADVVRKLRDMLG